MLARILKLWATFVCLIFIEALGASPISFSATAEIESTDLDWAQAVAEASAQNADVRAARDQLKAAQFSVRGAYGSFFPQVSATGAFSRGSDPSSSLPTDLYGVSIGISQNLFNGFLDRARIDQASADEMIGRANLETVLAQVSYDLQAAYSRLVYAQSSTELQREIIRRREENLRLVELRFESGRENKGSLLLSKAYLNQARYEELQARNQVAVAQADLARVLGRDAAAGTLKVSDSLTLSEPPASVDFAHLAAETPAHLQAVAQVESAEAKVTLARGGFFPALGLTGTLGKTGVRWFPENDRWSLGISLSIPLFSGGRDYFATRSAAANLDAAELTRTNVDRRTITSLRTAYASYVESVQKLIVDTSFLEASRTRAEIARNKYNNGLQSFDDWDIIENDLIARQRTLLQSRRDRAIAEGAWRQARGEGIFR